MKQLVLHAEKRLKLDVTVTKGFNLFLEVLLLVLVVIADLYQTNRELILSYVDRTLNFSG